MNRLDLNESLLGESIAGGKESKVYLYGNKIIKIFQTKKKPILENKYNKLLLLNKIDLKTRPLDLIYINDEFKGYSMFKLKDYKEFKPKEYTIRERIDILKLLYKKLEYMHKKGIVYGDIRSSNILINSKKDIALCDLDNVKINDYDFDILNRNQKRYLDLTGEKDIYMDDYVFNLYTVACLYGILECYSYECFVHNAKDFKGKGFDETVEYLLNLDHDNRDSGGKLIKMPK
ncbi:MAG: hypothetical protein IJ565_02350 [Bacilli bacterium]|nr:hypothetical protein [Bacilli bacterium]